MPRILERMAVVVAPEDEAAFIALAGTENLEVPPKGMVTLPAPMVLSKRSASPRREAHFNWTARSWRSPRARSAWP